jgi:hypothetical protein
MRSVLIAMLVMAGVARGDDVVAYEAEGDAAASGSDARVAALDDAFARAVTSALADLVGGDARVAHKGELDREVVGHARLWVKGFTVTRDETTDDRRQLVVSVRIDRDKLRARLSELNVATTEAVTAAPPADASARPIAIFVRVATPRGVRADYGEGADKDTPGLAAVTAALRAAGYAVRRAPATGPRARSDGDLPLSDDEADALAGDAKAELAVVAGVTVGPGVPARGAAKDVALVTAHVRLLEHKKAIGDGRATAVQIASRDSLSASSTAAGSAAAIREDGASYAIDRALAGALADVLPSAPGKLSQAGGYQGDDTPVGEPGVVLVRLPTRTPWHLVLDEQRYLAGAKGVRVATLRRMSPRGWVIGVSTAEPVERVAQIAKRAPTSDTTAAVKIVGGIVEVALSGGP